MLPSSQKFSSGAQSFAVLEAFRSDQGRASGSKKGSLIPQFVPVSGTTQTITENGNKLQTRPRPIFHISHEPSSDIEDDVDGPKLEPEPLRRSGTSGSQSTSESNSSSQSKPGSESTQDDIRRCHALMELLTTEVAYLMDLRALVNVSDDFFATPRVSRA